MEVSGAHVFPNFLTAILTQISFQSHRLLFSHASAEVKGENTPEQMFASTGSLTHHHQVMSPTHSPLSHPGGALILDRTKLKAFADNKIHVSQILVSVFHRVGIIIFEGQNI